MFKQDHMLKKNSLFNYLHLPTVGTLVASSVGTYLKVFMFLATCIILLRFPFIIFCTSFIKLPFYWEKSSLFCPQLLICSVGCTCKLNTFSSTTVFYTRFFWLITSNITIRFSLYGVNRHINGYLANINFRRVLT